MADIEIESESPNKESAFKGTEKASFFLRWCLTGLLIVGIIGLTTILLVVWFTPTKDYKRPIICIWCVPNVTEYVTSVGTELLYNETANWTTINMTPRANWSLDTDYPSNLSTLSVISSVTLEDNSTSCETASCQYEELDTENKSTTVDMNSTTVDMNSTTVDMNSTTVDMNSTAVDINSTSTPTFNSTICAYFNMTSLSYNNSTPLYYLYSTCVDYYTATNTTDVTNSTENHSYPTNTTYFKSTPTSTVKTAFNNYDDDDIINNSEGDYDGYD